jgi:hypothetical protein
MSATDTDRHHRLWRIGITEAELQALESIWNKSEAFRLIIDERTASLADNGYGTAARIGDI